MPQSHAYLLTHIVFSTKDQAPLIDPEVRPRLHAYLATVVRNADCHCYRVGGVADHVHLAVQLGRTRAMSSLIEEIKTASSKWMKPQSPSLAGFSWQRGYGAFSLGPSDLDGLIHYIDSQEEHHRKVSFQEEYWQILTQFGIRWDERYVWD